MDGGVKSLSKERKSIVTIYLGNIKTSNELHSLLKATLSFPDFYGENWDAFWDAITGLVEMPAQIRLIGWKTLEKNLPSDAKIMRECLEEYNHEFPSWKCEFLFS